MASKGFWTSYPQKFWTELDWRAWEKAGRPKVPLAMRLPTHDQYQQRPLVVPEPAHTLPAGVRWLGPKAKANRRDARGKAVDEILSQLGR
jgi:hypothetical protein